MKKIVVFIVAFLVMGFSFAQDTATDDMLGEFEGLFDDVQDIEASEDSLVAVPIEDKEVSASSNNVFFKPLSFSGSLDASVGFGVLLVEGKPDLTGYFSFRNDLSFSARGSKNLAAKGTVRVEFPNFALSVYELYFDYLFLDKFYITGGKKSVGWGYPQLFSGDDILGLGLDAFNSNFSSGNLPGTIVTNILSDCEDSISVLFQFPFAIGNLCAAALYPINATDSVPGIQELSFVGSLEITLLNTSFNIFARKYPDVLDKSVFGLEMKRTILGVDAYAQEMIHIYDFSELPSNAGYKNIVATAGLYKWWDFGSPMLGFNVEYQYVYSPEETSKHNHYVMFLGGISRLGSRKNIKVGVDWRHSFVAKAGGATLGVAVSDILPHARWKSALGMSYDMVKGDLPQMFLVTSIALDLDY